MKIKISELKQMLRESLAPYLKNEATRKALKEAFGIGGENAPTGGFDKNGKSGTFGDGGKETGPIKVSELSKAINEVLEEVLNVVGNDGKIHVWPDPDKMTPEDKVKFERETGKKPEEMKDVQVSGTTSSTNSLVPTAPTPAAKKSSWGKPREVELNEGSYGFGYSLTDKQTGVSSTIVEERDQVALAQQLGWSGKYISEAIAFLENNLNKTFEDPGYFITEKKKEKRTAKEERQVVAIKDSLRKQHKKDGKWEKGWDEDCVTTTAYKTFNSQKTKKK